jgi:hypothetical protein
MKLMEATALDDNIREQVWRYLAGQTSREEFEEWFVAHTWDERTSLAREVDHLFAEANVVGSAFDEALRRLTATVVYQPLSAGAVPTVATGSVMVTTKQPQWVEVRTRVITRALQYL